MFIEPYGDDVMFGAAQVTAASAKWQNDRASVTDHELKMLSSYDRDIANTGWRQREDAREAAHKADYEHAQKKVMGLLTKAATTATRAPARAVRLAWPAVADDLATPAGFEAWATKHGASAVPIAVWAAFVGKAREKRQLLESRITQLENQVGALTARQNGADARLAKHEDTIIGRGVNGVRWGGTYESNHAYASGELCTCDGNLWVATAATSVRPGSDPTSWRLVLRRGKA